MFKNLILASATAAVALTFSASDFAGGSEAVAKTATKVVQLKSRTTQPQPPTHKPFGGPSAPGGGYETAPYVDLYGAPHYPLGLEGDPGKWYCMFLTGSDTRPRAVQMRVNNGGDKPAGPVKVQFQFSGGKTVSDTSVLNNPASSTVFEADIPNNAWINGRANFTMRIDHPNQVAESNENNNVYSSFCLDPGYERQNPQRTFN